MNRSSWLFHDQIGTVVQRDRLIACLIAGSACAAATAFSNEQVASNLELTAP